ncbi:MAG: hypothetical protein ABIO94_13220 [Opitutaceae bacterium]
MKPAHFKKVSLARLTGGAGLCGEIQTLQATDGMHRKLAKTQFARIESRGSAAT